MTAPTEARIREIVREEIAPLRAFREDVLDRFAKVGVALHRHFKVRDDAEQPVEQHLVGDDIPLSASSANGQALELLCRAGFFGQHDVPDIDRHQSSPSSDSSTPSVGDGPRPDRRSQQRPGAGHPGGLA